MCRGMRAAQGILVCEREEEMAPPFHTSYPKAALLTLNTESPMLLFLWLKLLTNKVRLSSYVSLAVCSFDVLTYSSQYTKPWSNHVRWVCATFEYLAPFWFSVSCKYHLVIWPWAFFWFCLSILSQSSYYDPWPPWLVLLYFSGMVDIGYDI